MLIEIGLATQNLKNMDDIHVSRLFESIAGASFDGNHKIYLPLDVFEYLMKSSLLSISARGAIQKISEDRAQLGGLLKDNSIPKLTVTNSESGLERGTGNHFQIGFVEFLEGDYLMRPILAVENSSNDGRFYKLIFSEEAKRNQFSGVQFDIVNIGGKDNLKNMLKDYSSEKRIVAFVIDLDSVVPISDKEITNREKNREKTLNTGNCVGFVKYTPGHELENFLPLAIVKKVGKKVDSVELKRIESLIDNQCKTEARDCLWLYYDIVRGMNGQKDSRDNILINNKFKIHGENINWFCKKYSTSESKIENLKLPSFGDSVIKNFMKNSDSKDDLIKHMQNNDDNFNYWNFHFGDWLKAMLWIGWCDVGWTFT